MPRKVYLRILFDLPIDREFHYSLPPELKAQAAIGKRVSAPFGQKTRPGFIIGFTDKPDVPKNKIKEIIRVLDEEPLVDQEMLHLTRWISRYYFCSWGKALFEAVPAAVKKGKPKRQRKEAVYSVSEAVELNKIQGENSVLTFAGDILKKRQFEAILLFETFYSGKFDFYLQVVDSCLKEGRRAIILVPEILKTSALIKRFLKRYAGQVGILHSQLSRGEHYQQWQKIKRGEANIVIGTRSAVFAPLENLGLVIIDNEHDDSYKQNDEPRYHTREVALRRARLNQALVILSSPAPTLESFYRAENKRFKLFVYPENIDKKHIPEVEIVDMSQARPGCKIFSQSLKEAMKEKIEKKEQVILFLNRRGFATSLLCRQCGFILRCPNCNLPLIFHQEAQIARCHYCNHQETVPAVCPRCYSSYIRYSGLGTQKVEEIISRDFSSARVIRMDLDSVSRKNVRANLLKTFKAGKADFLIGTQMIAKDWSFPGVTLVGVISADGTLNLPDFRSGERTFQLLSQIVNQVGKKAKKGKVVIQTFNPEHPSLQAVKKGDYQAFYRQELKFRRELNYPPFSHLANIILRGKDRLKVEKSAQRLFSKLKKIKLPKSSEILGPVTSPYARIKGKYRRQIILKAKNVQILQKLLHSGLQGFSSGKDISLSIDIDPLNVL